jgi:hypothetical protein
MKLLQIGVSQGGNAIKCARVPAVISSRDLLAGFAVGPPHQDRDGKQSEGKARRQRKRASATDRTNLASRSAQASLLTRYQVSNVHECKQIAMVPEHPFGLTRIEMILCFEALRSTFLKK